jgi:hypothetical protein
MPHAVAPAQGLEAAQVPVRWILRRRLAGKTSRRRPIVAVIDRIDPAHRSLASYYPDSGKWAVSKESPDYIIVQGTETDYYKDEE